MADHRRRAIDNLDLLVESGGVHGFLGPNGSGKTTTIRVLLGLVSADAGGGEIRLLDRPVPRGLPDVIGGVVALVETPLFFPGFTGRLNLRLLAEAAGSHSAASRNAWNWSTSPTGRTTGSRATPSA